MFPWLKVRKKTDPELPYEPPIHLGNKSNGEFFHEQTPLERRMRDEILRRGDANARKLGIDRREFMASSMGMVTSMAVLNMANGCGDDSGNGDGSDGGYNSPKDAELDCGAAEELVRGDEFIFDLQTHEIEDEDSWVESHPGMAYPGFGFAQGIVFYQCELGKDPRCIAEDAYIEKIFLESDTTVAVLSGFPSNICSEEEDLCNALVSNEWMVQQRDKINDAAGGSQRMVQHVQVAPNDNWPAQAAMMERIREQHGNHGWKCYPPWGPGGGWRMDDPEVAFPFYDKAIELGNPLICAHKGFPLGGFNRANTDPADVGPAALAYPELTFIIYHSAFETGLGVGAYDPDEPNPEGVNRLVRTIKEHDLKGKNVYAELGSAWALSQTPNQSEHLIGRLVEALGEDNVLYGSECLWMGSPQSQIERMRMLNIRPEYQEMYGYPEMTDTLRRKILGLNAAKVYGIDPDAVRCDLDTSKLAMLKNTMNGELGPRRHAIVPPLGPRTRRDFMNLNRLRAAQKRPA